MHVKFQDEFIGSGNMPHTANNSIKSKNQHPSFDLIDIERQTPDGSKEAAAAATCPVHKVTIPQCALNIACLDLRRQEVGFKMIINCCRSLVKWNLETCYSRQLLFVSPDTKTLCNELCVKRVLALGGMKPSLSNDINVRRVKSSEETNFCCIAQ